MNAQRKIIMISVVAFVILGTSANAFAQEGSKITVSGHDDLIEYDITGAKLTYIIPDENSFSLILNIDTDDDGQLTLTLPRILIDSIKQDGSDEDFIILIDGMQVSSDESLVDSEYRKITIDFIHGDSEIEIIGTDLFPATSEMCYECFFEDASDSEFNSGWISFDDLPLVYEEPDPDVEISRLVEKIEKLEIENKNLREEIKNLEEKLLEQIEKVFALTRINF